MASTLRAKPFLFLLSIAAQSMAAYPERPIRYVIPSAAGGGPDTAARVVMAELGKRLNQQIVVDNRPGASGMIGTELIAKATPDGYTIGHGNIATLGINRSVLKLPYDLDRDVHPVVQMYFTPNLLAVTQSLPVRSVAELIAHAKKNSGQLFYASTGSGTSIHLSGELFQLRTATKMVHVPFKAAALAIVDLTAGRVHLMFDNINSVGPHVKAGKVRGLAVTSPQRVRAFPELPTLVEAGVEEFNVVAWAGIIVPSGVPHSIVARLNKETNAALTTPAVIEKAQYAGPRGGRRELRRIRKPHQEGSCALGRRGEARGREAGVAELAVMRLTMSPHVATLPALASDILSKVKITAIHSASVPIASAIRNAYIDFSKMTASVVAVVTDVKRNGRRVVGYGFNSNGRYAQCGLLAERFIPRIMNADPATLLNDEGTNLDPHRIWAAMMANEKPGGHGERSVAVGVIDMAVWDAVAKIEGKPLYRLLAERYNAGKADDKVFVYAAGGYYYPGKNLDALRDEMKKYLDLGYTVVKMKIGGESLANDLRRIEAVIEVLGSGESVAVDANGRFDLDTAIEYALALQPYGLFWYEEAGDPLDFALQAELSKHYERPMATGENLFSMQDARNLIRYGGMRADRDWLQFDCALSYGLVEYLRTLAMLRDNGWSARRCIPHGGHQMSLNIAAGLGLGGNESYPDVFQPFGGFADDTPVEDGHVSLPDIPGVGFEAKRSLYKIMKSLAG